MQCHQSTFLKGYFCEAFYATSGRKCLNENKEIFLFVNLHIITDINL